MLPNLAHKSDKIKFLISRTCARRSDANLLLVEGSVQARTLNGDRSQFAQASVNKRTMLSPPQENSHGCNKGQLVKTLVRSANVKGHQGKNSASVVIV
jgi:hypothetical protein